MNSIQKDYRCFRRYQSFRTSNPPTQPEMKPQSEKNPDSRMVRRQEDDRILEKNFDSSSGYFSVRSFTVEMFLAEGFHLCHIISTHHQVEDHVFDPLPDAARDVRPELYQGRQKPLTFSLWDAKSLLNQVNRCETWPISLVILERLQ